MAGNAKEFAADLAKFAKDNRLAIRTVVGKLALDIHAGLVLRTPRDTGRAKSNWIPSIDQASTATFPPDNAGRVSSMMAALVQRLPEFPVIWISNNLPYIKRLNEGWSKQAPAGFVEVTIDSNVAKLRAKP